MINLIPNQEKKKKVKDFYFRLTVVTGFLLSLSFFVALAAVSPALILSSVKKDLAKERLAVQAAEPVPPIDQAIQAAIDEINKKLSLIEQAQKNKYSVSARVVNEITLRKISGMQITQILYEAESGKEKKASVRGVARSREQLLEFRRALEDSLAFKKVELPISSFAPGSNIQFSLTLTPN